MKYCKICDELKPIDDFYTSQRSNLCKHHHRELGKVRKKEYRKDSKNKIKEKLKYQERKIRLWANYLLSNSKYRTSENTLTLEDIVDIYNKQNGLCYWFNVPLIPNLTKKHPQTPSLDRIDRFDGYTKENVVLCSYAANIGRNETPIEIWKDFIDVLFNKTNKTEIAINKEIHTLNEKLNEIDDRDEYVIYDDNMNVTLVKNLRNYCRENNISINTLNSARKKIHRKTQKGIIVLNRTKNETVEKRLYKLTSPDGVEYTLSSLREFSLKNNLNNSALQRVGKGELNHHRGWKCEYINVVLK